MSLSRYFRPFLTFTQLRYTEEVAEKLKKNLEDPYEISTLPIDDVLLPPSPSAWDRCLSSLLV